MFKEHSQIKPTRRRDAQQGNTFSYFRIFLLVVVVALFISLCITIYWFITSGRLTRAYNNIQTSIARSYKDLLFRSGFVVKNVLIEGKIRTKNTDFLDRINITKGMFIFDVDLVQSLRAIQSMQWVHNVRIERRLPDTIMIKIVEKQPIAFWQNKKLTYLIDNYGTIIGRFPLNKFPGYVVATGEGAIKELPALIQLIGKYNEIYAKTTGAIYISKRRWDIILDNNIRVKLPESGVDEALRTISELHKENRLVSSNVKEIDVRSKGRTYFYLSKIGLRNLYKGRHA